MTDQEPRVIAPNGLPITCWRADAHLEHEHADHPTYLFPVVAQIDGEEWETHALIYTDGGIAVTMYEYCYAAWYVRDGELMGGSLWEKGAIRLAPESLEKIRTRAGQPSKGSP